VSFLVLRAYLTLVYFDLFLSKGNFPQVHKKVREYPLALAVESRHATETVCGAVDTACIWYWKEVLCFQRSAATTCLLKRYGVPAQMIIGARQMPFKAHAWVEVDACVVNDKPYVREMYDVLDQC
jgi:transglutaminase superfamily protein